MNQMEWMIVILVAVGIGILVGDTALLKLPMRASDLVAVQDAVPDPSDATSGHCWENSTGTNEAATCSYPYGSTWPGD